MKRARDAIALMLLLVIACKATPAGAAGTTPTWGSALRFSAGIVAAFTIHEGSHALVAALTGTEMDWELGNYNQPIGFTEHADSDGKGAAVYSAGLIAQAIGSEMILQVDAVDKNDAFVRGMMAWNVVNPLLYALDYWFFRISNQKNGTHYQGDIEGVEHYTNQRTAKGFSLSMAAIASFQGYRFLKTQTWAPEWVKGETHALNFVPHPSGGLLMVYRFSF